MEQGRRLVVVVLVGGQSALEPRLVFQTKVLTLYLLFPQKDIFSTELIVQLAGLGDNRA